MRTESKKEKHFLQVSSAWTRISKNFGFHDQSSLKLELAEFKSLFDIAYKEQLAPDQINELFDLLDEEKKGYLNLENFFDVVDLIENNKNLTKRKAFENKFVKWYMT